MMQRLHHLVVGATVLVLVTAVSPSSLQAQSAPVGEWRAFGADAANTKYSPLDQITAENFTELQIAWRSSWSNNRRPRRSATSRILGRSRCRDREGSRWSSRRTNGSWPST